MTPIRYQMDLIHWPFSWVTTTCSEHSLVADETFAHKNVHTLAYWFWLGRLMRCNLVAIKYFCTRQSGIRTVRSCFSPPFFPSLSVVYLCAPNDSFSFCVVTHILLLALNSFDVTLSWKIWNGWDSKRSKRKQGSYNWLCPKITE